MRPPLPPRKVRSIRRRSPEDAGASRRAHKSREDRRSRRRGFYSDREFGTLTPNAAAAQLHPAIIHDYKQPQLKSRPIIAGKRPFLKGAGRGLISGGVRTGGAEDNF